MPALFAFNRRRRPGTDRPGTGRSAADRRTTGQRNTKHGPIDIGRGDLASTGRLVRRRFERLRPAPFLPRRAARIVRSRSFALLIGIGCSLHVQALVQRANRDAVRWGTRAPVVVAVHRLEAGHRIQPTDVQIRQWPTGVLPLGAASSVDAVVGRMPAVPVAAGQIFTPGLIAGRNASPSALRVGRGRVGVTIETGAARPELATGSDVVVIASPDAQARSGAAAVEGRVVAVNDRFVTVSVIEQQASTLASLLAGGPVYVALKGA